VLLAGESNKDTPRGLGVDIAGQCGLAGADCLFLFRAVSTPIHNKLVGINDRVQLTGKAKANPDADRLLESLRKHCDLLARHLYGQTTALARIRGHPCQRRAEALKDSYRLGETSKC